MEDIEDTKDFDEGSWICSEKFSEKNGYFWGSYCIYTFVLPDPLQCFVPHLEIVLFINHCFYCVFLSTVVDRTIFIDIFISILG